MASPPLTKQKIMDNIVENDRGCWIWQGKKNNAGYGYHDKWGNLVHRRAYELWMGPIPKGMQLDHRCSNKACCQPFTHLVPAPKGLNTQLAYIEKHKQMPWTTLRVARHLHNLVGEPSLYARNTYRSLWDAKNA